MSNTEIAHSAKKPRERAPWRTAMVRSSAARNRAKGPRYFPRALGVVVTIVLLWVWPSGAASQELSAVDAFASGSHALSLGKFDEAIAYFEAYADRFPLHPDASFDRGLAYLMRVRAGAEREGDLGQAAASFEESLLMRPGDSEVQHALALVHGEVARRRSRRGKDVLIAKPSLDRVVVGLASERAWGLAAIVASCLMSIGWLLRRRKDGPAHLAGVLLVPIGLIALMMLVPLYLGARGLRQDSRPGVLVVHEVHMTDESGVAQSGGEPLPEAARLEIGERKGRLVHVRYGSAQGWIPMATLRVLRAP